MTDRPSELARPGGGLRWRALGWAVGAAQGVAILLLAGPRLTVGHEDTDVFLGCGAAVRAGRVPYRDFPVEYPPLAVPLFVLPALVSVDPGRFKIAFAVEMLACNALAAGLVARVAGRGGGPRRVATCLGWYSAYALVLGRLIVTKYDAAPMLVAFAACLAWARGRCRRCGALAALGALIKVYPAALLAVAAGRDGPRGWRGLGASLGAFGATLAVGGAAWLVVGGRAGVEASIRYQSDRGLEYGSLASGAQMLAARALGVPIVVARDHMSFSTTTPWSAGLLRAIFPIQAAAILALGWIHARRGGDEVVRFSMATILAFVAAGKVFSPQFLVWLIPFAASLDGPVARPGRWLFLAVCLATLAAPGTLNFGPRTGLGTILAYNGRNLLILALLGLLAFGPGAPRPPRGEPGPPRTDPPSERNR